MAKLRNNKQTSKSRLKLKRNFSGYILEAGTDEAGRGSLSGPVVAAAVILPPRFRHPLLNDSKKLNEKIRYELRDYIIKRAVAWQVAFISQYEIDRINILNASILAMHKALQRLNVRPEFIIVDGNRFKPFENIPYETVIDGDEKYLSIAAASVLAKTFRDDFMKKIHRKYPLYNWYQNKGYATPEHKMAIRKYGITHYHRKSFHPNIEQLEFDFD